mmetsp:Transcript_13967/g.33793  ORF Transcript_13967/g.33793 Transcript_13967/m.33793 type:complete len:85 (+) Transcript_13967:2691-2945(+)
MGNHSVSSARRQKVLIVAAFPSVLYHKRLPAEDSATVYYCSAWHLLDEMPQRAHHPTMPAKIHTVKTIPAHRTILRALGGILPI